MVVGTVFTDFWYTDNNLIVSKYFSGYFYCYERVKIIATKGNFCDFLLMTNILKKNYFSEVSLSIMFFLLIPKSCLMTHWLL